MSKQLNKYYQIKKVENSLFAMYNNKALLILLFTIMMPILSKAQSVNADFTSIMSNPVCAPLSIPFNNTTTGATSYSWTVNGTFFSIEENPERVFTAAGSYEICLEASNDSNSDSHCETIVINAGPEINFTANINTGCAPLEITYTAVVVGSSNITELVWDFGDGNIMNTTELVVTHTYNSASIYDVTLTAMNDEGCTTFVFNDDIVEVSSDITPQFTADATSSCESPMTVNFTNTSVGNLDNIEFLWDFGNGQTSTEENPSHTYNSNGNYDVTLTLSNTITGCSNQTSIPNFINIGAEASFSFETNNSGGCNEVTATFLDETAGDVVIYAWDFGDGNTSILENPVHVYNTPGCHTPSLMVTTSAGCEVTYTASDCIEVQGDIELSYTSTEPNSCTAPFTVDFSTDYTGDISWDFGGQGTSIDPNPSFTFTELGTYPITLSATLANGCVQTVTTTTVDISSETPQFNADIQEGCAPLAVNFTDVSTLLSGNVVDYLWDFGDGNTSTEENPTHIYTLPGAYNVSLQVTLDNGCVGFTGWTNYVRVGEPPVVSFEADPQETCIENIVSFTDNSGDEDIDYWLWDFGDGSVSDQQHPLHEYNDTGYFDIKLVVGHFGCFDSLIVEDYMHLFPPKAVFSFVQDCSNPGSIVFTDSSIGADSWEWSFGDGSTSNEQNPTHVYDENGLYAVTLEVYNEESGCTDEMGSAIAVQNPTAEFTVDPLEVCMTGNEVIVSVTNTSVDAVEYNWYAPGVFVVLENANDIHPDFRFTSPGIYTGMTLTATDGAGCSNTFVFEDSIIISKVTPSFTYELIDLDCGQVFQFTDASTAEYTEIISWEWDFGDGSTSTEQNPTHMYAQGGNYEPTLTVTTASGCAKTKTCPNPLQVEAPFVTFDVDEAACLGDISYFINNSIATDFVTWEWNFGDGNTSSEWSPSHTYSAGGTYTACFSATNSDGCTGMNCVEILVEEIEVDFIGDEVIASCSPHVVSFTDLTENAVNWVWDFGDNSGVSTLQNPSHTYINSGDFTVCLTVTTASGCTETLCKDSYIEIGGPVGVVTYDPSNEGCNPFTIEFNMTGSNIDSYILDFGDGATESDNGVNSNNFTFEHTYNSVGEFTPVLLLSDDQGCENFILLDTVFTQSLSFTFDANEKEFCVGSTADFTSEIIGSSPVQSIEWTFEGGNPSSSNDLNPTGIAYNQAGIFDVILTVDLGYCSETIIQENFIVVHPEPELSFTPNPNTSCGPAAITFENNSTILSGTIVSYNWDFGNGETSNLLSPTSNYTTAGEYVVTLLATSNEGCTSETEETITIFDLAQADILLEDYVLCQGQSITLEAEVNGTPTWSPSTGLSCTNCEVTEANPNVTTTYYLTSTTPDGCTATDSITIERVDVAPPVVTLTEDRTICPGEMIQIIATGGNSPFDYQWDDTVPGLSCYENCSNPIVEIFETSIFSVSVSNQYGCVTTESITITVTGSELDILGPDRTICEGGEVPLNVQAGENPRWEVSSSLSCTDCFNPMASPNETTTYSVTVDYLDCEVTQEITVFVINNDQVNAGENIQLCLGQSASLNGLAPGDIEWSTNGSVFETESLDPEINPTTNTTYVLTASNDLCVLSDTVEVIVDEAVQIIANDVEACIGETVQLLATGNAVTSFEWNNSEFLSATNVANPFATVTETTTFMVTANSEICNSNTATVTVFIKDAPEVVLPPVQTYVPNSSVTLNVTADDDGTYTYNWNPNTNISCTDCKTPTISPSGEMIYTVEVMNSNGCMTKDSVILRPLVDCLEDLLTVPTGFSPNGDGQNDELKALGIAEINLFRIYNRWGELMFETTNPSEGWDGTFKSRPVNTDVFVWYIEAVCPIDGSIISKKGDVTLVR